jgi:hypothetical protein
LLTGTAALWPGRRTDSARGTPVGLSPRQPGSALRLDPRHGDRIGEAGHQLPEATTVGGGPAVRELVQQIQPEGEGLPHLVLTPRGEGQARRERVTPAGTPPAGRLGHHHRRLRANIRAATARIPGDREAAVVGAADGPEPTRTRDTRTAATLNIGCLDTGSHSVSVSWFAARPSPSDDPKWNGANATPSRPPAIRAGTTI